MILKIGPKIVDSVILVPCNIMSISLLLYPPINEAINVFCNTLNCNIANIVTFIANTINVTNLFATNATITNLDAQFIDVNGVLSDGRLTKIHNGEDLEPGTAKGIELISQKSGVEAKIFMGDTPLNNDIISITVNNGQQVGINMSGTGVNPVLSLETATVPLKLTNYGNVITPTYPLTGVGLALVTQNGFAFEYSLNANTYIPTIVSTANCVVSIAYARYILVNQCCYVKFGGVITLSIMASPGQFIITLPIAKQTPFSALHQGEGEIFYQNGAVPTNALTTMGMDNIIGSTINILCYVPTGLAAGSDIRATFNYLTD